MHSSIFSSEQGHVRFRLDRFTKALLIMISAVLFFTELITIITFDHTSRVQLREVAQRRALLAVKDVSIRQTPHVAILGNSLLLDGVDVPFLASKINETAIPAPYFVLGTEYYDWLFGLKRLFSEGMRPRTVMLGLSPSQLASYYTRGDYSARYLFQASDLIKISQETGMDPTRASGFVLAHFSQFYSTRDVTRGFLMSRLLPSVGELLHSRLGVSRAPDIEESVLSRLATQRLAALNRLCSDNGSRFLLVVPPTYEKGAETVEEIGNRLAIPVLVPVSNTEFDSAYYKTDGYHLNEKGARAFTARLSASFLKEQAQSTTPLWAGR